MSQIKRYLEWVSVQMGMEGQITAAVIKAAEREETVDHYRRTQRELRQHKRTELDVPVIDN